MTAQRSCYSGTFMRYIGIDIGGTTTKAGLVNETGQILESRKIPTATDDLSSFFTNLTAVIADFQKSARVDGVGVGIPGLRSFKTHAIETSPNIPCLNNVSLEDLLSEQVHQHWRPGDVGEGVPVGRGKAVK